MIYKQLIFVHAKLVGMLQQKISIYLNPKAGNAHIKEWEERISKVLFRSELFFRTPGDLEELRTHIQEDVRNSVGIIVSVGGDGTMNTLIQHLAGTDIGLLVMPGGTANDLAQELGNRRNINKVIQCIRMGISEKIDVINVNGKKMATNGGLGIGANVARSVNCLRRNSLFKESMRPLGNKVYGLFTLRELMALEIKYKEYWVESTSFKRVVKSPIILINNQPMLAGMLKVAPETQNADGKFNVTILTHERRSDLMVCILQAMKGHVPEHDPHFISFETDRVHIEAIKPDQEEYFFGDGELFLKANSWDVTVDQGALKVYSLRKGQSSLMANKIQTMNI